MPKVGIAPQRRGFRHIGFDQMATSAFKNYLLKNNAEGWSRPAAAGFQTYWF